MAWFGPLLAGSGQQQSGGAPPADPVLAPRAKMLGAVLEAFQVATVIPLFTSAVLAHTNAPPAVHAGRQVDQSAIVRSLHPEPAWHAQTARKLPVSITAVAPVEVPLFSQPYRGDFSRLTWEAQTRPKLLPIAQVVADAPPHHQTVSLYGPLASHYAPPTITPLWGSSLTVEGAAAGPVDNPPFSMRGRQAQPIGLQWTPRQLTGIRFARLAESVDNPPFTSRQQPTVVLPTWDAQTRPKLIQGAAPAVENPPLLGERYRGAWPTSDWAAQASRTLPVIVTAVPVHDPPFTGSKYAGEWPTQTWETQSRPKLVQPFIQPVNDPPFTSRRQPTSALPTWAAQTRPTLIQAQQAPAVDNPPVAPARFAGDFSRLTWDAQTRPKLIHGVVAAVENPPALSDRYRGAWPTPDWAAQASRTLPVSITAVPVDDPPFTGRKYAGEWPALTWETQARPKLVPIQPPVPTIVLVRGVVGAVGTLSSLSGNTAGRRDAGGDVATLSTLSGSTARFQTISGSRATLVDVEGV